MGFNDQLEVLTDLIVAKQMDIDYYWDLEKGQIPDEEIDLLTVDTIEEVSFK